MDTPRGKLQGAIHELFSSSFKLILISSTKYEIMENFIILNNKNKYINNNKKL
jgi:hypothetical protein